MTTSDEISPLLSLSLPQKHDDHCNIFQVKVPRSTIEPLTNVQDFTPEPAKVMWFCRWLGCHCGVPFTLLMSAIGAGTLAVPYTFVLLSPLQAVLVLCFVGLAMSFTADTLVDIYVTIASDTGSELTTKLESYQHLAWKAGGTSLARITGALTALAVFGACVGCLCVVKDMTPIILSALVHHFNEKSPEERQQAVVLAMWIVVLMVVIPLGCLTKLSALRYSSYFGVIFLIYLVGAVAYRAASGNANHDHSIGAGISELKTKHVASLFWRVSEVVGIYNFTFMLHLNVIPLLAQLVAAEMARKNKTLVENFEEVGTTEVLVLHSARRNMRRHLALAVGACIFLYAIFGLCAVQIYGRQTQGNILLNLSNDRIMAVPRVVMLLTILLAFPLLFLPLRLLVLEMYVACVSCDGYGEGKSEKNTLTPSRVVQASVTFLLLVAQVFCAVRVPGIQVVFSFVGASILLMLCYLFPLIFYVRLTQWRSNRKKMTRLALLVLVGAVATLFCVTATLEIILPA